MMTGLSHQVDDLLLRHAAGALDAGFSLLVETHLALSSKGRKAYVEFEALGGALIDQIEPVSVDPSALNRALRLLDEVDSPVERPDLPAPKHPRMPEGLVLPAPLRAAEIGRWRWIGPGVRSAAIVLRQPSASRAFLLEIGPGVRVPMHGHEADEATCVLRGGFRDGDTHFGPGDVARVDETMTHDILIDTDVSCLCLIAMEGRTVPANWLGRLYQRFRDI
jgi:putative transcriptional regulator